jgi:hypothetical protein
VGSAFSKTPRKLALPALKLPWRTIGMSDIFLSSKAFWLIADPGLTCQMRPMACQCTPMNSRTRPVFLFPRPQCPSHFHTVHMAKKMESLNCHTNNKLGEPRLRHLLHPTATLPRCFSIPRRLILSTTTRTLGLLVASPNIPSL